MDNLSTMEVDEAMKDLLRVDLDETFLDRPESEAHRSERQQKTIL